MTSRFPIVVDEIEVIDLTRSASPGGRLFLISLGRVRDLHRPHLLLLRVGEELDAAERPKIFHVIECYTEVLTFPKVRLLRLFSSLFIRPSLLLCPYPPRIRIPSRAD